MVKKKLLVNRLLSIMLVASLLFPSVQVRAENQVDGETEEKNHSEVEELEIENVPSSDNSDEGEPLNSQEEITVEKEQEESLKTPEIKTQVEVNRVATTLPYKRGDRADEIIEIKRKLNRIGFGNIKETNLFGSFMEKKVMEFQKHYGISVTGIIDQTTMNTLNEIYHSPYQLGKRNPSIADFKRQLNWLGYGNIKVTDYYGDFMEKKVKQYQTDYHLPVSGIIDFNTQIHLENTFLNTYKKGSRHRKIVDLKRLLNETGYGDIKLTTLYGSFTEQKVKEFQEYHGLKVTGRADLETIVQLEQLANTPFSLGKRHKDTIQLKKNLNRIGFGNIKETELYGSYTEKRVKDFQRYYGLKVTGVADQRTLDKINEIINSPLQKGKRNNQIVDLKRQLNWSGYGNISETNYFGSFMEKKVKEFQADHGLPVSGIIDNKTKQKIQTNFSKIYQRGSRHPKIIDVKKLLNNNGFGNIKLTNLYGSFTEKQVKEFQKYYGLKATGKVDLNTLNQLIKIDKQSFRQGQRHQNIVDIKKKLNKLGFGHIKETNLFGSYMEKRVKDFQRYYGLKVTGVADQRTLDKINEIFNSPLQKGKRHNNTIKLKKNLNQLGFGNIIVTTLYGDFTEKRVRDFQKHYGLVVNGIADPRTLAKIDEILSSPFQLGKRHPEIINIKKKLNTIGYGTIKVTNYFGSFMEKKLKQFQRDYKLPVSGIADPLTINKLNSVYQKRPNKKVRIVIDAGHGGSDPGAKANKLKEKDLTLYIAKEIEKELKKYKNVDVKMIRTKDEFLSLQERSKLANGWKADFYLSVHINAGGGTGIESYVYNKATQDEIRKQATIHDHLASGLRNDKVRDRGKKKANFHVLRETNMSALLVEYLFIDNVADANKLKSNSFKKKMARLTAEGIAKAYNLKK